MNQSELLLLAQQYMADKAIIVVVALLVLGYFLKRTPWIQDWMIPWTLMVTGILLACGVLQTFTVESIVQGILAAGIATLTHQLWKQTMEKRKDDER